MIGPSNDNRAVNMENLRRRRTCKVLATIPTALAAVAVAGLFTHTKGEPSSLAAYAIIALVAGFAAAILWAAAFTTRAAVPRNPDSEDDGWGMGGDADPPPSTPPPDGLAFDWNHLEREFWEYAERHRRTPAAAPRGS